MANRNGRAAAAIGGILIMAAASAFGADVDAKLQAYQASSDEATRIMAGMTDATSAKANAAALDVAMNKHRAAEAALNTELGKLNLGNSTDGKSMEAATAAMAKSQETMTTQEMRILSNPAIGDVVGRSLQGPAASKR